MNTRKLIVASILGAAFLSATCLATLGQNASRAADTELEQLDHKIKDFLQSSIEDDLQIAYQELLAGGPLLRQTEAVANLVQKTKELQTRSGPNRLVEQISAKRIGRDVVVLKYLYSGENLPAVWYFTYYRVYKRNELPRENSWAVIAVRFDSDLELLALTE